MATRDYNGVGKWAAEAVLERYSRYAKDLSVPFPLDLRPRQSTKGDFTWTYPVMDEVIKGIESGDSACIAIGIEFVEEDQHFAFGKILKSNTARALRRAELSEEQVDRLRKRIVGMLLVGMVPHEFKQYAKLLNKIGLGTWWPIVEQQVLRENQYVMRYYNYLSGRRTSGQRSAGIESP